MLSLLPLSSIVVVVVLLMLLHFTLFDCIVTRRNCFPRSLLVYFFKA